jgi:hypothetical protein
MALTPEQVDWLAARASADLQQIQQELGRDGTGGVVAFPRGYLPTVGSMIGGLTWISNHTVARNLCYHVIFGEVLRWLLNRTDLYGVARGMVMKHLIALMGTIAECLTVEAMKKLGHGTRNFGKRIAHLLKDSVIDEPTHDALIWLWDARAAIHVYEVTDLEADKYAVKDCDRAIASVHALSDALYAKFGMFTP